MQGSKCCDSCLGKVGRSHQRLVAGYKSGRNGRRTRWRAAGAGGDAGREAGARGRARAGAGAQSIPVGEAILRRLPVRTDCILPVEDARIEKKCEREYRPYYIGQL